MCVALKKYFEAHLAIRADQIRRSHMRNEGGSPLAEIPAYKVRSVWLVHVNVNAVCLLYMITFKSKVEITIVMKIRSMSLNW